MNESEPREVNYDKVERFTEVIHTLIADWGRFIRILKPDAAAHAATTFKNELRSRAFAEFAVDYALSPTGGQGGPVADFYLPEEATIVTIAFDLRESNGEFERSILKALMVQTAGRVVTRLLFLAKAGARARCNTPIRKSITEWAASEYGLQVEIREMGSIVESIFDMGDE